MLIDRTHRKWALVTLVLLMLSTVLYFPYRTYSPHGPSGGTTVGLIYGIAGFALMLYAGLLGLRKKFPVWRIGRAQTWMRGHLWLGALSLPLIFFHAGLAFGGLLTTVLMILFLVVWVSGLMGAALQHFMPRVMLRELTMETVFEQITHVQKQLLEEAERVLDLASHSRALDTVVTGVAHRSQAVATAAPPVEEKDVQRLQEVYSAAVRPYLLGQPEGKVLANARRAEAFFQHFRTLTPPALHSAAADLENICEEKRQLDRQQRLHYLLHGWLLVHVPLSLALMILSAVHAVVSLAY